MIKISGKGLPDPVCRLHQGFVFVDAPQSQMKEKQLEDGKQIGQLIRNRTGTCQFLHLAAVIKGKNDKKKNHKKAQANQLSLQCPVTIQKNNNQGQDHYKYIDACQPVGILQRAGEWAKLTVYGKNIKFIHQVHICKNISRITGSIINRLGTPRPGNSYRCQGHKKQQYA